MSPPKSILQLIEYFKRLPGVGRRSAERYAYALVEWPESMQTEFSRLLSTLSESAPRCDQCGVFREKNNCANCADDRSFTKGICIVAHPRDVLLFRKGEKWCGVYHVLGGLLSPMEEIGPDHLLLQPLQEKVKKISPGEVIIALDATLEGDVTTQFLKELLSPHVDKITRLAMGVPLGSTLDYVDGDTLSRAMEGRSRA